MSAYLKDIMNDLYLYNKIKYLKLKYLQSGGNNTNEFIIETYNVDGPNIERSDKIDEIIYKINSDKKGIYLYQELNIDTPTKLKKYIDIIEDNEHLMYSSKNLILMKQFAYLPINNTTNNTSDNKYKMEHGNSFNGIIWSKHFKLLSIKIPTYYENDILKDNNRLGGRTTPWITLLDTKTNKTYTVLSLHLQIGIKKSKALKRVELLESIFNDSKMFQNPIIGGDFNMKLSLFIEQIKVSDNLKSIKKYVSKKNMFTITNLDIKNNFSGRLDWILFGKNIHIKAEQIKSIKQSESDHAIVRYFVY